MKITNNLIIQNIANSDAGGIRCSNSGSSMIVNNTIASNQAGHGGGMSLDEGGSFTLTNTILWGNSPQQIYFGEDTISKIVTISYSDVQGGQAGIVINNNGTVNWQNGNIDKNPLFVNSTNSNYHLSDYSPCIGVGTANGAPTTDIEGKQRPTPAGSNPDMGAYENDRGTLTDTTPPVTSIILSGTQGENGWYTSDVTVTLTATDNLSGVKQTTYKIGNGQWQVYSSPFIIKESATMIYKSEDNAGNVEIEKIQQITIKAMNYYISSPSNEKDRGGLIIPSDTFPEGKGSVIPIYIPSIVDGSSKIREDTAWKTVKEINKAKLNFEWDGLAKIKFETADTPAEAAFSFIAGLLEVIPNVISISACKIIIQKDSGGNFRAIIQVGDPDYRTFIGKYAGEGVIDPLADSFWLVQATFSDQIAKTF
ncbi:MAG: choice-of-anchor Q domain-containing protein, partial [Candidatus Poribacteria bacterium]